MCVGFNIYYIDGFNSILNKKVVATQALPIFLFFFARASGQGPKFYLSFLCVAVVVLVGVAHGQVEK